MNENGPTGFDAALLDDFFAEADEHLLAIRQALLHLESTVGQPGSNLKIVEELFRNFHSFKGISAIVGLASAEEVAHATEDFLRLMRNGRVQLTGTGSEMLMVATQKLEQIVAAFRAGKTSFDSGSLLADLKRQCENVSPIQATASVPSATDVPSPAPPTNLEEAKAHGLSLWKYIYSPSAELTAQGININFVREELLKTGEILKSTPVVREGGSIVFEFVMAARGTPSDIPLWAARGVKVQPAEADERVSNLIESPVTAEVEEAVHNPFLAPSHFVRVDLKRLDDLMRMTGEMVIHRSRLESQLTQFNGSAGGLNIRGVQETSGKLGRSLRELREAIMRVRMVPVAEIFARMPFVLRDLARESQKKVRLKLQGEDTAIDKYLVERLKDPLLHLVRNAFTHGIESPAERLANSKPEEGTIILSAESATDSVIIQIRDDGKGIDPNFIVTRARKLGLEIPEVVDDAAILKILCSPGFSTRDDADRAAGRGVGMAVVLTTVRELGGNITLESAAGKGTQFTLRLPLTLAISETLIISAAGQTCAIPQNSVREILQVNAQQIQRANGVEVIPYRSGVLPIIRLTKIFQLKDSEKAKLFVLVIVSEQGSVGLSAENILGQREVVIRALQDPLIQVAGIMGATELGDGKPVLILDAASLISGNFRPPETLDSATEKDYAPATRR